MPTTTITADDIISRYAADIGFVAEVEPATDLGAFVDQLHTAAQRFSEGGINQYEEVEDAATCLIEALNSADETERNVFLRRADEHLTDVWDMTEDYRCMVGN